MATNSLSYRVRPSGRDWHWEVRSEAEGILASGSAENSVAARAAAFLFCLRTFDEKAKDAPLNE